MRLTIYHATLLALILTVVPGLKTIAKAQQLSALPSCAQPAILAAVQASGCKPADTKCICSNPDIFPTLTSAIQEACSLADQAAVQAYGQTYCASMSASASMTMSSTMATQSMSVYPTIGWPSFVPAPNSTNTTATGPLTTDSSSMVTSMTASAGMPMSSNATMSYSTPATATATPTPSGGAVQIGLSSVACVVAVGAMGWVFAEL